MRRAASAVAPEAASRTLPGREASLARKNSDLTRTHVDGVGFIYSLTKQRVPEGADDSNYRAVLFWMHMTVYEDI